MTETLMNALVSTYDWFVMAVFMPVLNFVGDNPWLAGVALLVVLAVIVIDTMRTEASERVDEDAATEAEWAARR